MPGPTPHGKHTHGGDPSDADRLAAKRTFNTLQVLMEAGRLPHGKLVRELPGGGVVVALDMGGVKKTIVFPGTEEAPELAPITAPLDIPMLFSGNVTGPVVRGNAGVEVSLSTTCRRRLNHYDGMAPQKLALQRFRVDYNVRVDELKPKDTGSSFYSQYTQLLPSWYSGASSDLVQVVLGYGRQDFDQLPDDRYERAVMQIPPDVLRRVAAELGECWLPGYTGLVPPDGQVRYDYKPYTNNAVAFDQANAPWLLDISARGVYAMPLPMVPATITRAFREYVESKSDSELLAVLDRFGGLPSGESFPAGPARAEWEKAGVIVKVCEVGDFYKHSMYYVGCGWALNEAGTEGFNTCYDYKDGIPYGMAYKMRLGLTPAKNRGMARIDVTGLVPAETHQLIRYIRKVLAALQPPKGGRDNEANRAARYKLVTAPLHVLRTADSLNYTAAWWKDYTVEVPIATHSGSVSQTGSGWLYHPARFAAQPQIKFPDPHAQACLSHDFGRLEWSARPDPATVEAKGTIMWGYYIGNELKVVKYHYRKAGADTSYTDNFEPCMYIGSWESERRTSPTHIYGHFTTSDFDEREDAAGSTETTKVTSRPLGFDGPLWTADDIFYGTGWVFRNRWFYERRETRTTGGFGKGVALCVPYFTRSAVLHAWKRTEWDVKWSKTGRSTGLMDPHGYRYWTYQRYFWRKWGELEVRRGSPEPDTATGEPVWVEYMHIRQTPCAEYADQGPFLGTEFPLDVTGIVKPFANTYGTGGVKPGAPNPRLPSTHEASGPTTEETSSLDASILPHPEHVNDKPNPQYFYSSPDHYGNLFYVYGMRTALGDRDYCELSEQTSGGDQWRRGHSSLRVDKQLPCFIGVVNE